jgi:hypothetical protein
MFRSVDTKDAGAVEKAVQAAYFAVFPGGDSAFVPAAFAWTADCFQGRFHGYQAVDARYHDFEHTMQGTLCMTRLLRSRHEAKALPVIPDRLFQLGILGILLHDTGYLKTTDDLEGTGAKYTVTHVSRSADFAALLLAEHGFGGPDILAVQNMVRCTGVDLALTQIPFQNRLERTVGWALGTADLLGQMAAADYPDKLPLLFEEFAEAARFTGDPNHFVARFSSAAQLMENTPDFWENSVLPKLELSFGGLYRFLNHPYPDGPNDYLNRIQANMARLKTSGPS